MPVAFRSTRINRTPIRRKFVSVHFCDSHSVVPIFFLFLHFYALLLKYASISRLKRNFKTNQLDLFNFDSSFFKPFHRQTNPFGSRYRHRVYGMPVSIHRHIRNGKPVFALSENVYRNGYAAFPVFKRG